MKVRTAWEAYLTTHSSVALKDAIDGKPLHHHLNDLAKEYATGKVNGSNIDGRIKASLDKFIVPDQRGAQN
ncbi:MAG: hypothetical protein H7Y01_06800 [Ferruginibacter sp.]|nr:hypothetical protein [Chitinophagaceae bacterium]